MAVDWANPCAALAALRLAYYELLQGKQVSTVSFMDRSVNYTQAQLKELQVEIARLEGKCAQATGGARRRFAITASGRNSRC